MIMKEKCNWKTNNERWRKKEMKKSKKCLEILDQVSVSEGGHLISLEGENCCDKRWNLNVAGKKCTATQEGCEREKERKEKMISSLGNCLWPNGSRTSVKDRTDKTRLHFCVGFFLFFCLCLCLCQRFSLGWKWWKGEKKWSRFWVVGWRHTHSTEHYRVIVAIDIIIMNII